MVPHSVRESPPIYFTLNSAGLVLAVNCLVLRVYTAQELTDKPIFNLFHPEDQASLQESFTTFLDSSLVNWKWEVPRQQGQQHCVGQSKCSCWIS